MYRTTLEPPLTHWWDHVYSTSMSYSASLARAAGLLALICIWYYGNLQFGFVLHANRQSFTCSSQFLALLWITLFVGTTVSYIVAIIIGAVLRRAASLATPRPPTSSEHDGPGDELFIHANVMVVLCHLLGFAFTCLAFILGTVQSVQVKCKLAKGLLIYVCAITSQRCVAEADRGGWMTAQSKSTLCCRFSKAWRQFSLLFYL